MRTVLPLGWAGNEHRRCASISQAEHHRRNCQLVDALRLPASHGTHVFA